MGCAHPQARPRRPELSHLASAELIDFVTAAGHTYEHRWRAGDVILWDNRAVLHRGRPWPNDKPRHMVRTTITATDADGLSEMRPSRTAA
ncbi:MAG TPA: TauD/TfdA family dioxygenase [Burkholderiales bacterium]|nr:TauD/TfdA family dioxygenase [Burkholderiales bacterium]